MLALSLLLTSCAASERKDNIIDALHHLPGFQLSQGTKAIVIISDNSCIPCNESFSTLIATSLNNPTVQFVIAAHASHLDLTPYINSTRKDIMYDTQDFLAKNNIIKSSAVVFIKNGTIDTAISVTPRELNSQLSYIQSKMQ